MTVQANLFFSLSLLFLFLLLFLILFLYLYHPPTTYLPQTNPCFQAAKCQNPCSPLHLASHPSNHGLSPSVSASHSPCTQPLATCSSCHFSSASTTTPSTRPMPLYASNALFAPRRIPTSNPGTRGSVRKRVTGVKMALKLNRMAPDKGSRRSVCQSTRRWMRVRSGGVAVWVGLGDEECESGGT